MKSFGIIYKVENKINGRIYIGQTVQGLRIRKNRHINDSLRGNNNIYFNNAIRKYGPESFMWSILDNCDSKEELDEMEFHYIMQYNSLNAGYNLTLGGEGSFGYLHSAKNKKTMSEASFRSNNHCNRGKHLSKTWKKNIALANKGKTATRETRERISKSKAGKFIGSNSKCAKRFVITDPNGSKFLIHGLSDFSRRYKDGLLDFRLLSAVAVGKRNHHKGYKCRYFDEDRDKDIKLWNSNSNRG